MGIYEQLKKHYQPKGILGVCHITYDDFLDAEFLQQCIKELPKLILKQHLDKISSLEQLALIVLVKGAGIKITED